MTKIFNFVLVKHHDFYTHTQNSTHFWIFWKCFVMPNKFSCLVSRYHMWERKSNRYPTQCHFRFYVKLSFPPSARKMSKIPFSKVISFMLHISWKVVILRLQWNTFLKSYAKQINWSSLAFCSEANSVGECSIRYRFKRVLNRKWCYFTVEPKATGELIGRRIATYPTLLIYTL